MSLRVKLFLGYLAFVVALAALGVWSAVGMGNLGGVSRRIISDNYDSVLAAQDLKESLERQDSAAVFFLLGQRDLASEQLAEHRRRFDDAFSRAANNITEPGEAELVETVGRDGAASARGMADHELRRLALEFNRMAEALGELRRSDLGELLVAQRTAEAAIGSLSDPVLVTDEQGRVTRLNGAAEKIFGPEASS